MKRSLALMSLLTMSLLGMGCSTSDTPKEVKVQPSRGAQSEFNGLTLSQVKNSLMAACSEKRLQILTAQKEVTCTQKELTGPRKREIENVVNDEFATNIYVTTQFKLEELGRDVKVSANIYADYLAPVSVLSGLQPRTRNLLDDQSFSEMSSLLESAKKTSQALK